MNANVMRGRFFLSFNGTDTECPTPNARFVIQGSCDNEKGMLVHTASTVRGASGRLLVTLSSVIQLELWGFDVTQAYLQSDSKQAREVSIEPPPEMGLGEGKILRVVKALYSISDAGFIGTKHSGMCCETAWGCRPPIRTERCIQKSAKVHSLTLPQLK